MPGTLSERWGHPGDCEHLTPDVDSGRWCHSVECGYVQGLKSRHVTPGIGCWRWVTHVTPGTESEVESLWTCD